MDKRFIPLTPSLFSTLNGLHFPIDDRLGSKFGLSETEIFNVNCWFGLTYRQCR